MLAVIHRISGAASSAGQLHPMTDYRRLACPSCGKSYKYRGGLMRHIAECFPEQASDGSLDLTSVDHFKEKMYKFPK
ncbi:Protein of unknown function [Cotesia congregata]|uniref:C2H2-type domain-containing protein n=1 Tax=Cotesia congregata TaxID=51543 RepID=A0A8J2HHG9_COTCN|nr:Protein of unknown function [Cotesia congregata]